MQFLQSSVIKPKKHDKGKRVNRSAHAWLFFFLPQLTGELYQTEEVIKKDINLH